MHVQKFFKLIDIEIGQHPVPCHKCRDISLIRKLFHLFVCLSIFADINDIEPVTFLAEILLSVNAP